MSEKMHIANLGFILEYTDGTKKDEIESEIFRTVFEKKGLTHYNRENGGSFGDIEQNTSNSVIVLLFMKNIIESIYRLNAARDFNPYIVVGYNDVKVNTENGFNINIGYRLLQDLSNSGMIEGVRL